MELDLGMLGVARKLVVDVVYQWRQKFEKNIKKFFLKATQTANDHF
jgi:hypothetical protein